MPAGVIGPSDKLTDDEKVELIRGLTAEYARVKVPLAQSKKPLDFNSDGTFNRKQWDDAFRTLGPAARVGDQIKITKITLQGNSILLDINGGLNSGRHWYDNIQIGMGGSTQSQVNNADRGSTPTLGTYIEVLFHKPLEALTSDGVKKILAPIMDFDQHSATQIYSETLPPETQKAIADKRAIVGMDREQVKMALGQRDHNYRYTDDGVDKEDWIYGTPPGKITFVTFAGNKVVAVKETYAGLGSDTVQTEVVKH